MTFISCCGQTETLLATFDCIKRALPSLAAQQPSCGLGGSTMVAMELIRRGMEKEFPPEALSRNFYGMFDDPERIRHLVSDPFSLIADARRNFMTQTFGVEIELDRVSVDDASRLLQEFLSGERKRQGGEYRVRDFCGRDWVIDRDGSVPNGFEIASPQLTIGDMHLLGPLLMQLRQLGARTGDKTGIHIHVGTQGWKLDELVALLFVYSNYAPEIALALDIKSSRRAYCKPIRGFAERMRNRKVTPGEFKAAWFTHEDDSGHEEQISSRNDPRWYQTRYREMNFLRLFDPSTPKAQKTIEFRGFNATDDEKTLQAYILFILSGVSFARALPAIPMLDGDLSKIDKPRFFRDLKAMMKFYLLLDGELYEKTRDTFRRNFNRVAGQRN